MNVEPIGAMEAAVGIGRRRMCAVWVGALLGPLLGASGTTHAQVRQDAGDRVNADTQAQRIAPEDRDAAAREAADRLEALGGEPEALLGAPARPGDPYGSAFDATERSERALIGTERVPRGALTEGRYATRPVEQPPAPGMLANKAERRAGAGKADPGTQSPTESALSIYHGPGDVGKAVGQVYKMPW
jgi:hypothetical protein